MGLSKILILILVLELICSCGRPPYKDFVNKHENEDFSVFMNKCVFSRGRDKNGLLVIFVYTNCSRNEAPFIVYADNKSNRIIKTSTHLMKDTSNLDRKVLQELAIKFLSYNILSLEVDTNKNVFIGMKSIEEDDLVKFSDQKYRIDKYKHGWYHVKDNWYAKQE